MCHNDQPQPDCVAAIELALRLSRSKATAGGRYRGAAAPDPGADARRYAPLHGLTKLAPLECPV